jgi:mono/diheme cytochrome c family protein
MLTVSLIALLWNSTAGVVAAEAPGNDAERRAALAVLEKNCISCHGAAQMSGLDMRQREGLLKGGKRGPAIVPEHPEKSLLYLSAAHQGELKMPLGSTSPLPAEDLAALKKWIEEGALWPADYQEAARPEPSWWSFKKPVRPPVPHPKESNRVVNPIDAFVLAKLEEKGLTPAPRADKLTLVRRAYFDLIGLPPTPEEVDRFMKDTSPNAWANLIDTLQASPRYGERWGRRWLDVVRYADTAGFEADMYYPNAWRYRDYVIKSFNDDKPYDRFVQEQIAGDELWPDTLNLEGLYGVPPRELEHLEARVGTGLYSFGPEVREDNLESRKLQYEWLTDTVDTTGSAFMGLTFKCARCHDHKFDPIAEKDYYRLQAVFAGSQVGTVPVITSLSATKHDEDEYYIMALEEARNAYMDFENKIIDRALKVKEKDYSPEAIAAYNLVAIFRTPKQAAMAAPLDEYKKTLKVEELLTPAERLTLQTLTDNLAKAAVAVPQDTGFDSLVKYENFYDVPSATVLKDLPLELVPTTYMYSRGDVKTPLEKVTPGLPGSLLADHDPYDLAMSQGGPRFRKELALWLTKPDHPLTARVMVNRIWEGHFGAGIVATENDFGHQGVPPSNQELLDWLATEFIREGWSIKSMNRLIMLSSTYQMASRFTNAADARVDPQNAYLWRMNRTRLEGEAVWDSIHVAAGDINFKMGGRAVMPPLTKTELNGIRELAEWVPPADPAEANRRGVYIMTYRDFPYPLLDRYDMPGNAESCPRRDVTTVAPQVLWTLNSHVSMDEAQQFAVRLVKETGDNPPEWIDQAWRIALSRPPSTDEKSEALAMLAKLEKVPPLKRDASNALPVELAKLGNARAEALTKLCLTIFNLDEFVYVD